jgi:hypothetical protein
MFMQAWGNYGTAWPVVHQQLGLRPDLGNGAVSVVPQVPLDQPSVQGTHIRLGRGSIGIRAAHSPGHYTTEVDASRTPGRKLTIGVTLPRGAQPRHVVLDGRERRNYRTTLTNRGVEVTIKAAPGERHVLVVS